MAMTAKPVARPVDHLVFPTADLGVARERLGRLGFAVAPDGRHPFGTANCCVYLSDGTFLEPLAIADAQAAGQALEGGNVFVARDHAYRKRNGSEGFSAVVFGTGGADADHRWFVGKGLSAGEVLEFSRPFVDAAGKADTASFRLAFAVLAENDDSFLFSCERVNTPAVDRRALERHDNGVIGISAVIARTDDPLAARTILLAAAWGDVEAGTIPASVVAPPQVSISMPTPSALAEQFGVVGVRPTRLALEAVVFATTDPDRVMASLDRGQVAWEQRAGRIVVPRAPGQGAVFAFEVPQ